MSSPRPLALLLLAFVPLLLPCCQSGRKHPPQWQTREIEVPTDRLLWEVTAFALQKEGFPVGSQMDPATLTAVSGWRYDLAPFRGAGYRERAEIRFEPVGPGRYRVRVRVEKDVNMDHVRPLDLSYARWEAAPDDGEKAGVLLQRLQSWIRPELQLESKRAPRAPGG